ncbi:hypothetical protein B0H67DRAFT_495437 [Lasiosphaeris hirsuta]|uniref:Mating-type switching protein swi10 n=1 Tax=Lasiosphaeris hirsuta TaxID=260670 RepID=A0AA40DLE6_9PEZI|nr:hypothetical protein B0H67DRAFT_495437 [Lasiosphaeris hirsuta]
MAQTKQSSLAAPPVVAKAQTPRLRRKLQKSVTKQRSNLVGRLGSGTPNEAFMGNKCDTASKSPAQAQSCLPSLPLPTTDPSDSKWSEFFRGRGCLYANDSASQSAESLKTPVNIIPELSHLAIRDAQPRPPHSSEARVSPGTTMRRRAKTPIFSIGQLEAIPRPCNALGKTSSVELIAEQYRALLDPRNSIYSDSHSEPPPSRQGDLDTLSIRRQHSADELRVEAPIHAPLHTTDLPGGSPTSDDGTLVAFEEETVYFKPVSFSPEPLSPHFQRRLPSPPPTPDNLSLQICLDLLTRDLSSALACRPSRSSPETSALQVWVMIEAYERLHDRIAEARLCCDELRPLEMMFDMWLRALYTIHDSLTGDGRASESEYGEMGTEDLD